MKKSDWAKRSMSMRRCLLCVADLVEGRLAVLGFLGRFTDVTSNQNCTCGVKGARE